MKKERIGAGTWLEIALWAVLGFLLLGSLSHTAWLCGLREEATTLGRIMAWVIATGIDAGIAMATASIRYRKKRSWRARVGFLRLALWVSVAVSIYANLAHALGISLGGEPTFHLVRQIDLVRLATSAVVSVPLPLLVLALAETAGSDVEAADRRRKKGEAAREPAGETPEIAATGDGRLPSHLAIAEAQQLLSRKPAAELAEIAKVAGRSERTVRQWLADGKVSRPAKEEVEG